MSSPRTSLGPLSLSECPGHSPPPMLQVIGNGTGFGNCICPCCDKEFAIPEDQSKLLEHLFTEHRLVIADLNKIALIIEYVQFWKPKFKEHGLPEYCTTMLVDTKAGDKVSKDEKYFLLSDVLPIDNQLRKDLQRKRLEKLLAHQKLERDDKTYERECLFCRTILKGSRSDFLSHLNDKHNFYIAKLENLIFTSDLIEFLNDKLTQNICIYCEKVFKDRMILKEHMRKKVHKRINPNNEQYDKYFISNYMEIGKNWQSYLKNVGSNQKKKASNELKQKLPKSEEKDSSSESDSNWSDWEESDSFVIICLFCKHSQNKYADITSHMKSNHNFDFNAITKDLNFYDKLKIVNYIRRQVYLNKCIKCNEEFIDSKLLLTHMSEVKHFEISDSSCWNQPEFYFSTYEDDGLLFCLEDDDLDDIDILKKNKLSKDNKNNVHISQEVALSVIN